MSPLARRRWQKQHIEAGTVLRTPRIRQRQTGKPIQKVQAENTEEMGRWGTENLRKEASMVTAKLKLKAWQSTLPHKSWMRWPSRKCRSTVSTSRIIPISRQKVSSIRMGSFQNLTRRIR